MTTFEPTGTLYLSKAGDILIISESPLKTERLEGVQVILLLSDEGKQTLTKFISEVEISDISKALTIGRGTAGRIKRALDLSTTYDKDSATTKWRRKKQESK